MHKLSITIIWCNQCAGYAYDRRSVGIKRYRNKRHFAVRIAVHPELQGRGIGQKMLQQLDQMAAKHIAYLSTSFGATEAMNSFANPANTSGDDGIPSRAVRSY